jgi:putative liporotein
MKTSKKMMTVVLGAALIGGLLPITGYSKPKKGQKSAIEKLESFFAKEDAANKKTEVAVSAVTNNAEGGQQTTPEIIKKTFACGNETITVEYGDGEKAVLTDGKGKTHELTITKAASGELYSNKEGVSIHMKENYGVYTSSSASEDVSCEISK